MTLYFKNYQIIKKKTEKTEGRIENEFNLTNKDKISLNDLLKKNVSNDSEYSGLRKNMERLVRAKKKKNRCTYPKTSPKS